MRAQGDGHVVAAPDLDPVEAGGGHAHDGEEHAVQAQRAADGGRVAAQLALPEGMADHHARGGAAGHVVLRREEAPGRRADSHRLEEARR